MRQSFVNIFSSDLAKVLQATPGSLIAALTQRGIVVNYPNVKMLNAEQVATRSEVSALLYQALSSTGQVTNISSQYVVGQQQIAD
ncbi:MAG: hypothetical protein V7L23_09225 [Nostoc sp.]|uniref:hypothetical protein n=1 Tax=Nostoc sp. TaxID=1180 RepID=UPI002FF17FC8